MNQTDGPSAEINACLLSNGLCSSELLVDVLVSIGRFMIKVKEELNYPYRKQNSSYISLADCIDSQCLECCISRYAKV